MTTRAKLPRLFNTSYGYHPDPRGPVTWWHEAQAALDAANSRLKKLVFNNADAIPKTVVIECSEESVPMIMDWYGMYYAGDRYTVTLDGRNIHMDQNGSMKDGR